MYVFVDRPVASLSHGGTFLIWSMRIWLRTLATGRCPPAAIGPAFSRWKLVTALPYFHMAMMILNRDGLYVYRFAPPDRSHVGEDEALVLALVSALHSGSAVDIRPTLALMVNKEMVQALLISVTALANDMANAGVLLAPAALVVPNAADPARDAEK